MISTISPLEVLSAFFLAFLGGIVCGLSLVKYTEWIRRQALCDAQEKQRPCAA